MDISGLSSTRRIDRERTVLAIKRSLTTPSSYAELVSTLPSLFALMSPPTVSSTPGEWEGVDGSLSLVKTLLLSSPSEYRPAPHDGPGMAALSLSTPSPPSSSGSALSGGGEGADTLAEDELKIAHAELEKALVEATLDHIVSALEHVEPRVRSVAAETLEGMVSVTQEDVGGVAVWNRVYPALKGSITSNFTRDPEVEADAVHESEGWKSLETSMNALMFMIRGLGKSGRGAHLIDSELMGLLYQSLSHENRFVRETGYQTIAEGLAAIVGAGRDSGLPLIAELTSGLVAQLGIGLADNWSQVRFSACVAARTLVLALKEWDPDALTAVWPTLLPRLCLNRYYVAQGVKNYSLETWALATAPNGPDLVATYIEDVVTFYISQSEADNHAVREAACYCIAELGSKIAKDPLRPHVPDLVAALIVCFHDQSWPVRDTACSASGEFVAAFPSNVSESALEELWHLWLEHVSDNIWSVRENAATALGRVIDAFGEPAETRIMAFVADNILKAEEQPADSTLHSHLEKSSTFGVAGAASHQARANDPTIHENQPMYSCGSLAPKLKRGAGCMDHGFSRPPEPWESSDGCVYLVREILARSPQHADTLLPHLATLSSLSEFTHWCLLSETVWKQLPGILIGLDKATALQDVAATLALFTPSFVLAVEKGSRLLSHTAYYAYMDLGAAFGREVVSGVWGEWGEGRDGIVRT